MTSDEGPIVKLGDIIGRGGIAKVYCGQDLATGKLLAVKKSRVSLTVQRTAFQHEARILFLLRSHSAIPQIYAIGRFEHFEYLCLELLGPPLRAMANLPREIRMSLVPQVAIQMLSALKFIHGMNIVHRDVKPDNMLVCSTDQRKIRLIDFSLAYTSPSEPVVKKPNLNPDFVMGTLAFASLNAHQGLTLGRRDDLESLGYTLFWLLRGNLPWSLPHLQSGTLRARRRQVFAKKQAWPGARLARDSNVVYGNFLEVARSLSFSETLNYDMWREVFRDLTGPHTLSFSILTEMVSSRHSEVAAPKSLPKQAAPFIVASGQLVHIQVLAQPTIENYTAPQIDPSYWFDPSLSKENWRTIPRPAVVLKTWRNQDGRVNIKVALLTTRGNESSLSKILLQPESKLSKTTNFCVAVSGVSWPKLDVWCCAYLGTYTFTCLPTQTKIIPLQWKLTGSSLEALVFQLENQTSFKDNPNFQDTVPRLTTNAQISRVLPNVYIQIYSLNPRTFWKTSDNQVVDWDSERGWFDELISLCRRRIFDEQRDGFSSEDARANDVVYDSCSDGDRSVEWSHIQRERADSLTLGWSNYEVIDLQIPVIREIE